MPSSTDSFSQGSQSNVKQLLESLRDSIVHKPPFVAGSLQLPPSHLSLLYNITSSSSEDNCATRHINFANATPEELDQLIQACEPASFGRSKEEVMDETYRKARKMDNSRFAPLLVPDHTDLIKIVRTYLLEGEVSKREIKIELYKLNVYSEGSFFKAHVDTPRGEKMFGSLVVVLPTPHEGGTLVFRHHGQEWTFDSSTTLLAALPTSIAYAAFFCDVEHEISPVTSGHRVTLTYNLHYGDDEHDPAKYMMSKLPSIPQEDDERGMFCSRFSALLDNPDFLPYGGFLGFGMRHVYQVEDTLEHVYGLLKGSDATVYESLRRLGFKPTLYLNYKHGDKDALFDGVPDIEDETIEESELSEWYRNAGDINRPVTWVTPNTTFETGESAYIINYGNEPVVDYMYGKVCLIVRIGRPGDRFKK